MEFLSEIFKIATIVQLLVVVIFFNQDLKCCESRPVIAPGITIPPPEIIKFMRRFGYLDTGDNDSEAMYHEEGIIDAIKNIQKFGNISQTGILDNETLKLMTSPRCGVPDIVRDNMNRRKRYIVGAKRWQKRKITYFIANWSPKVGEDEVAVGMDRAFAEWSRYSNLKFSRVYDPSADIIVAFGTQYHGDNYPFDGPGNILAHAYYPYEMGSYGGDVHFDNDENWKENTTNLNDGVDFYSVAIHELGHSLGLAHSPVYNSIMFPYYKGSGYNTLDFDDILAMYNLYVTATFENDDDDITSSTEETFEITESSYQTSTTTSSPLIPSSSTSPYPTTTKSEVTFDGDYETVDDHLKKNGIFTFRPIEVPTTAKTTRKTSMATSKPTITSRFDESVPNICVGYFDAVSVFRGDPYIFKGKYIWRLTEKYRIMDGFPVEIHQMFPFLPLSVEKIDAAYERNTDDSIILFTGKQYWVYDGYKIIENSPLPISNYGISNDIERIDAAMLWPKNDLTYLFSGNKFWRFDETIQRMDEGYPKNMNRWRGIPDGVDAVATMPSGKTYFFKDNLYWLYNNKRVRPVRGYPRRASNAWLGCSLLQQNPY